MISQHAPFVESPVLRSDLVVVRQERNGTTSFLVQDPDTHEVFEMGEEEYFLSQQLDGQTPLDAIQLRFEERFGAALSHEDLEAFLHQLAWQGLLVGTRPSRQTLEELFDPFTSSPVWWRAFFNGDRLFTWLESRLRWLFTRPFMAFYLLLNAVALYILLRGWSDLWSAVESASTDTSWLILLLVVTVVFTQPFRAVGHGVTCKHYGGRIGGVGIFLYYYIYPALYLEWQSYRRFSEKQKRVWSAAAGMYTHFLVWAPATILWWLTTPESPANTFWLSIAVVQVFGLAFFGGNPFLAVNDINVILVEVLEIPKLRERSLAAFGAWLFRQPPPEPLSPRERRWFMIYGGLTAIYTILILTLIWWEFWRVLTTFYQGAGAVAALMILFFLAQKPLGRFLVELKPVQWILARDDKVRRWLVRLGIGLAMLVILLLPYPYETGGPFTILSAMQTEVHCEIDGGRIEQVFVVEGAFVSMSQPLGQIDRREYETNIQTTHAQLETTEANLRLLRKQLALLDQPPNIEQIQALAAEVRRLETQLADYQKQLDLTTMRAPVTGRVTTALIEQKVGQYLKKGDLFATVEHVQALQVEIQVPEGDVPQVRIGERVKIVPWAYPHETFLGSVKEIAPIAAVPSNSKVNSVRVIAEIPNADLRLKPQLTGFAKIKTEKIPVWLVLSRLLVRWLFVQVWYWLP